MTFPIDSPPTPPEPGIGKVASPARQEANSEEFYFWVNPNVLVEKTQIVRTDSTLGGDSIAFYGVVKEVFRRSRQSDMAEEIDRHDGDVSYHPPYDSAGFTYAKVGILRTVKPVLTPPLEGSVVTLGGEPEAKLAYAFDEIEEGQALAVGLVKNGGSRLAGPGHIDLDYLLGANGGHLNVTGVAGRGTKSSFLLHVNYLLLRKARHQAMTRPGDTRRTRVVPIILNVKNFDLFHIDRRNRRFDPELNGPEWRQLGIEDPGPFTGTRFFAPQLPNQSVPRDTGRPRADVKPYSWSLADIVERGLWMYLLAEEDMRNANFAALAMDLESWLTRDSMGHNALRARSLADTPDHPRTLSDLLEKVRDWSTGDAAPPIHNHLPGTWRMFYRRLLKLVLEGNGVLRRDDQRGNPLSLTARDTVPPAVVDLSSLAAVPSLQRFVVATLLRQLVDDRTGSAAQGGLVYLVTLDELNRFAPRGGNDPITQLVEQVAAEMRSQGIILLGAQQQASLVSTRVIENAGIRALGKTGSMELGDPLWRFLGDSTRRKAASLLPNEKLLIQDSFREPMLAHIPFPPWALRRDEATDEPPPVAGAPSRTEGDAFDSP